MRSRPAFVRKTPDRVRFAPPDVRSIDPQAAHDIYSSRYRFGGFLVDTGGVSPFQIDNPPTNWLRALHGFRWLRHLGAAGTDLAAANARSLCADWIRRYGQRPDPVSWDVAATSKRVIAWLQHSSILLNGAELPFYRAFMRSLAMQVAFLQSSVGHMPVGKARLRVRVALAFAALSLPAPISSPRSATRSLENELKAQVLPDGGHVSRNPLVLPQILADLIPLLQTYALAGVAPPASLEGCIDRMAQALRFLRHRDGTIARFNGVGVTVQDRIENILGRVEAAPVMARRAAHSGYDRLDAGGVLVLADTGAAPPAGVFTKAHAGCLSFEMSSNETSVVVNCGVDLYGSDELRQLARATAAHSTATLEDTSQGRFTFSPGVQRLIGSPLLGGARSVDYQSTDDDAQLGFVASHAGYLSRFGLLHRRGLSLSREGDRLEGFDEFFASAGAPPDRQADIRFHLHPRIKAEVSASHDVYLWHGQTLIWQFRCDVAPAHIEQSIYLASEGGPKPTTQIVVGFNTGAFARINWEFRRAAGPPPEG